MIRRVKYSDRVWILKLMNEKEVRANSFTTEKISKETNDKYWKKKLKQKGFEAYAIKRNSKPIGLIRIIDNKVSIAITKKQRNKGIAYKTLSKINLENCYAEIKTSNKQSKKLFKKLGFRKEYKTYKK